MIIGRLVLSHRMFFLMGTSIEHFTFMKCMPGEDAKGRLHLLMRASIEQ